MSLGETTAEECLYSATSEALDVCSKEMSYAELLFFNQGECYYNYIDSDVC